MIQSGYCVVTGGADKYIKIWRPSTSSLDSIRQTINQPSEFQIEEV